MRHDTSGGSRDKGFTLVELLFVVAVAGTLTMIAVPSVGELVDTLRTEMAARYLAARLADARLGAVKRSTSLALRFEADGSDYTFTVYADGNGNGVRTAEIVKAIDSAVSLPERLRDKFPEVAFGLRDDCPDVDGGTGTGPDGIRIGAARIASMSPDGTATAGTLYVRGRRSQFAIRILGATGRVRVLRYRPQHGWVTQ